MSPKLFSVSASGGSSGPTAEDLSNADVAPAHAYRGNQNCPHTGLRLSVRRRPAKKGAPPAR